MRGSPLRGALPRATKGAANTPAGLRSISCASRRPTPLGRTRSRRTSDHWAVHHRQLPHPNHLVQTRAPPAYLRRRNANARHRGVLAAERRERTDIRSEKGIRWADAPLSPQPDQPEGGVPDPGPQELRRSQRRPVVVRDPHHSWKASELESFPHRAQPARVPAPAPAPATRRTYAVRLWLPCFTEPPRSGSVHITVICVRLVILCRAKDEWGGIFRMPMVCRWGALCRK